MCVCVCVHVYTFLKEKGVGCREKCKTGLKMGEDAQKRQGGKETVGEKKMEGEGRRGGRAIGVWTEP